MPNEFKVIGVERRKNETIDRLLKRFKKEVKESDILKTFFENRYYEKPSHKKRRKRGLSRIHRKIEESKEKRKIKKRTRTPKHK